MLEFLATMCLSFDFLEFLSAWVFPQNAKRQACIKRWGSTKPHAEVSYISHVFFWPGNYPLLRVGADYQDSGKILGCFLINIDLSCAKILDFFPQKSNLRDVLPRHSDFIYMFWVWPMTLLGFSCLLWSQLYTHTLSILVRDQSWRIFKFLPIYCRTWVFR